MILLTINIALACEDIAYVDNSNYYDNFVNDARNGFLSYHFYKCVQENTTTHDISIAIINTVDPEYSRAYFFDEEKRFVGKFEDDECFGIVGCEFVNEFYPYLEDSGDTALPPPPDPTCGCASSSSLVSIALLPMLLLPARRRR
jgi:hypothetical protein